MVYTTINKSTDYFNTFTFNGTGGSSTTGVGFTPDMFIHKNRGNTQAWGVIDVIRGNGNYLGTNTNNAELSDVGNYGIASDGYTFPHADGFFNSGNMVYYNWKAGGAGSSNSNGSITSTVSANTTAGFSIVSYTGTGSNATVGHGLGVAPKIVIVKNRSGTQGWGMYNKNIGAGNYLALNTTQAISSASTIWNSTEPTTTVFSVGTSGWSNDSGNNYIAYCFAEKTGYSKLGSYEGNQSADGTFIFTGFKPAFVLSRDADGAGENWFIHDNKRNTYNPTNTYLRPNLNNAEGTAHHYDFYSNGFKNKYAGGSLNSSGRTYIYMAFAEAPLVGSNNVPCTAR